MDRPQRTVALHALRGAAAALTLVLVVAGGVGWLYLLRRVHALHVGPGLAGALPLERLAGHDRQPLLRVAVAWLPAGLVAGLALVRLTALRRGARGVVAGAGTFVVLVLVGGVSDAVTESDPVGPHLRAQPHHAALWVAAALVAAGALIVPSRRARTAAGARAAATVATRFAARGSSRS